MKQWFINYFFENEEEYAIYQPYTKRIGLIYFVIVMISIQVFL